MFEIINLLVVASSASKFRAASKLVVVEFVVSTLICVPHHLLHFEFLLLTTLFLFFLAIAVVFL